MGGGGGGAGAGAGPCGEGGRVEWLRIYGCMVALLRKSQAQVEALLADRTRLEAFVKIQHEFWVARVGLLQAQLQQMRKAEASRRRCEAANLELLLGDKERELRCCQKLAELTEDDLEDFITSLGALAAENSQLKIKLKEVGSRAELSEHTADHEHCARDLRAEIRKLKQAYKTLSSKKDKEVSALLAEKDFVWNQLRTMEQDYTMLLKSKKIEAAQATEAAQKLKQNVEELQVATQQKDGEIGRLRANAADAKKKISILEDKLQEMRSLAKEKDYEIEKLKDGQPETSQKRKKYINDTHRKSRSEGPALREKSKNSSRRQMVDEDEQPKTSQKRNCTSSLSHISLLELGSACWRFLNNPLIFPFAQSRSSTLFRKAARESPSVACSSAGAVLPQFHGSKAESPNSYMARSSQPAPIVVLFDEILTCIVVHTHLALTVFRVFFLTYLLVLRE